MGEEAERRGGKEVVWEAEEKPPVNCKESRLKVVAELNAQMMAM